MGAEASPAWQPSPVRGWVAPHLASEFPGLAIATVEVDGRRRRSPEAVRRRLRNLSDRFYGSHAIHMRERPIPWAYRVFFRHIGLDPDRDRTPIERLVLQRLQDGAFRERGMPGDALTIAIAETGVALQAFDAELLEGGLCIRDAAPGESLEGSPGELSQGTMVLADARGPVAVLFGPTAEGRAVGKETRRLALAAIQVAGVPDVAIDEALWIASASIESA